MYSLHQTELFKTLYPFAWLLDIHTSIVFALATSPKNQDFLRKVYGKSIDAFNNDRDTLHYLFWARPDYPANDHELQSVLEMVQGRSSDDRNNKMYHVALGTFFFNQSFVGKMSYLVDLYFGKKIVGVPAYSETHAVAKMLLLKTIVLADAIAIGNSSNSAFAKLSMALLKAKGIEGVELEKLDAFKTNSFIAALPKINPAVPQLTLHRDTESWMSDQVLRLVYDLKAYRVSQEPFPLFKASEFAPGASPIISHHDGSDHLSEPAPVDELLLCIEDYWEDYKKELLVPDEGMEHADYQYIANMASRVLSAEPRVEEELAELLSDCSCEVLEAAEEQCRFSEDVMESLKYAVWRAENASRLNKEKPGLERVLRILAVKGLTGLDDPRQTQESYFQKAAQENIFK